jgi:ketosteroid isomerase-like protein
MDQDGVNRWLDAYVEAWKTYDPEQIGALFSDDVAYRYHPYDDPIAGREAVVASWLGEAAEESGASSRDEPGTYEASYRAVAVDGDTAVATGTSTYRLKSGVRVFENCFLMRFDADGRCAEFTEWFMERPSPE